ncbi:uncharacterized protein PV09_05764 [Verruconis gallopava]|uniref:AB hydrolase-1 domain-containing protein n=1 Tax=Verruconis gallopava TaxID=253628 RepID=A0A0D1XL64_9PEZI|nr:uncharacterized protein PV09_05764 [Verruconis gallopava]KIW03121.1 hypothetical protein PV09_05764 [Verruconis gallopava]
MPFLKREHRTRVYYEVHGEGTPLILTHGFSSTSAMWRGQIEDFTKAGYKVITWDMRGHGRSTYPDDQAVYSEAHTIDDMAAILDQVCGTGSSAIVGGLSLGGYMSLAFYRKYPQRVEALLIIDTGPGFKSDAAREAWNKDAQNTAAKFERDGLKSLQSASAERSQVSHRNAEGLAMAARGMLAQRNNSVIMSLPSIKVPSLVVVGADDKPFLAASDYMQKKIPGCKKVVIPNAGHAANIDQPERFNEAVLSFLASIRNDTSKDGRSKL